MKSMKIPSYQKIAPPGFGKTTMMGMLEKIADMGRNAVDEQTFRTALEATYPLMAQQLREGNVTLDQLMLLKKGAYKDNSSIQSPERFIPIVEQYGADSFYGDKEGKIPQEVKKELNDNVRRELGEMPATAAREYIERHGERPGFILTAAVAMTGYHQRFSEGGPTIFEERYEAANQASPVWEGVQYLTAPTHIILPRPRPEDEAIATGNIIGRLEIRGEGKEGHAGFDQKCIRDILDTDRQENGRNERAYFRTSPKGIVPIEPFFNMKNSEEALAQNAISIIQIVTASNTARF